MSLKACTKPSQEGCRLERIAYTRGHLAANTSVIGYLTGSSQRSERFESFPTGEHNLCNSRSKHPPRAEQFFRTAWKVKKKKRSYPMMNTTMQVARRHWW